MGISPKLAGSSFFLSRWFMRGKLSRSVQPTIYKHMEEENEKV